MSPKTDRDQELFSYNEPLNINLQNASILDKGQNESKTLGYLSSINDKLKRKQNMSLALSTKSNELMRERVC